MIICGTGPLVAALNAKDAHHQRCLDLLEQSPGPLLVPAPVVTEVCWLLESVPGRRPKPLSSTLYTAVS